MQDRIAHRRAEAIYPSDQPIPRGDRVLSGKDPMLAEQHADLGYQSQLRELLPVRARPGAPVCAEARAADLGRGRVLPALRLHGVSHAHGVAAARHRAWRRRPGSWGAGRAASGSMALEITRALGGRAVAVVSDDASAEFCPGARRGRGHQPQPVHALGPDAEHREREGLR